jgi:NAD dependent epimerase/dehydratase
VFHLAALIGIPYSYHSPDNYVDTNVKGTLNVLQAGRDFGTERILVTSTSEVYGTARFVPISEDHARQAQSPYSATKIAADALADSFYRSFSCPVITVRPFNTYGPRQSARAVIPTIIAQLLAGQQEIRLGSLHPTRDLNYVTDICEGFVALARCDEAIGKDVNIGSGTEVSIGELAQKIIAAAGIHADIVADDTRKRPDRSEVERLVCDNERIKKLTSWEPSVSLNEGLARTIEWFRDNENLKLYKPNLYNV